jgi:hypothetical protein
LAWSPGAPGRWRRACHPSEDGGGDLRGDSIDPAAKQVDSEQLVAQGQREQLVGLLVEADEAVETGRQAVPVWTGQVRQAADLPRAARLAHPDGGGGGRGTDWLGRRTVRSAGSAACQGEQREQDAGQ